MKDIAISRSIQAPVEKVFGVVSDIEQFSKAVPAIVKVEYLTDQRSGVGARFRETRKMGKREMAVEFEVTEFVENRRFRLVADTHGTVWDSVFSFTAEEGGRTRMEMVMAARSDKFFPRLMNSLSRGMMMKSIGADFDLIKAFCEEG